MRIVKSLLGLVLFEETDSFGPFFPVVAPATALGCVATCAGHLRGPPAGSMRDMGERGAAGRRGYQGGMLGARGGGRARSEDARGTPLSLTRTASAPEGNPRPRLRPHRATRCGCTARSTRPGRRGRPGLASVRPEASRFSASSASYCPFSVKKGETGRSKGTLVLRNQVIVLLHYFLFT